MGASRAGGPAMAGGQRFQAQVTAWWCARILLRTPVGQLYNLPPSSMAERVYCETADEVDDIRIELTNDNRIFGQCKKSMSLSANVESEWGSVLAQFYREFKKTPLAPVGRRFVLFYEKNNASLERLKTALARYRELPLGSQLADAVFNENEQTIVNDLNALLDDLQTQPDFKDLPTHREELLRHIYIHQLRLYAADVDYLGVADALQYGLLTDPIQTIQTLTSLHRLADDLLAERGTRDRIALRERLQGEGITLRESVDYWRDFQRLEEWAVTVLSSLEVEGRVTLTIGDHPVSIPRPVVESMFIAAQTDSFLVVGEAGGGKTGSLTALVNRLRASGQRVWYWPADSLPYHSPQQIGTYLHLQHPWAGIFAEAASGTGATLIIDGLDGLRDTSAQRAYRQLLSLAIRYGIRVVASIRAFDLRYATNLQEVFPAGSQPLDSRFLIHEFRRVNHIAVLGLSDEEFVQAAAQLPGVIEMLQASPHLLPVVRNLFSLDLLCKLIRDGDSALQLSSISTQAELFERFWAKRVTAHEFHDEITVFLTQLIGQMVSEQTLQVTPTANYPSGEVKNALFSVGIIRNPPTVPGRLPNSNAVEFYHHLLFDYAAELLFIRPKRHGLAGELASSDTWGLFLRPSLILFFRYMWMHGRLDFWDLVIELQKASVPVLQKMLAHLAVAQEARSRQDLQPLLNGGLQDNPDRTYWIRAIHEVISTANFFSLPRLFRHGAGEWWLEFARDLIQTEFSPLVHSGQWLLFTASSFLEKLPPQALLIFNQADISLVRFHLEKVDPVNQNIRFAIKWLCLTIDSDLPASSELIRCLISPEELKRAGYIHAYEITSNVQNIWKSDVNLAVEIYDAIFGYVETDRSPTSMTGGSLIFSLTGNRKQDYEMSYYHLTQAFPAFMSEHPVEATRALIRAFKHLQNREYSDKEIENKTFIWNGRECYLTVYSNLRWDRIIFRSDNWDNMLEAWQNYLSELPAKDKADETWQGIAEVLTNENAQIAVWKSLLMVGHRAPEFYAPRLWSILANPVILLDQELDKEVEECIEAFAPHLTVQAVGEIESAILSIGASNFPDWDEAILENTLRRVKGRLLYCIPEEIRGDAASQFLAGCDPQEVTPRRPEAELSDFPISEHESHIKWPEHQVLLESANSLMQLNETTITNENLSQFITTIHDVERMLKDLGEDVDAELASNIQLKLVSGTNKIVCSNAIIDDPFRLEAAKRFREALASAPPPPSVEHLERFDSSQWWSVNTYSEAAEGFVCLALKGEQILDEDKDLLRRLSEDPEPVIRFHLGRRIWFFLDKWDDFVWETLERWTEELPMQAGTSGVLKGSLHGNWFWWLRHRDTTRADQYLRNLLRASRARNASDLQVAGGSWLAALSFFKDETWAGEELTNALETVKDYLNELNGALRVALDVVFPEAPNESRALEQKQRAADFILRILKASSQALISHIADLSAMSPTDRPSDIPVWVKETARFFDTVAVRFQHKAEGHGKRCASAQADEVQALMVDWWSRVDPILDAMLAIPHPPFIYHLVEGIEHLIKYDVGKSLHWLRRATLASAPEGLTNESIAADKTIGMLEAILADHKASLAVGGELRSDFIQILEAYLLQGWPRALELAGQLESVFR